MSVEVKICGLTDPEAIEAAIEAGADDLGLVVFPSSPRVITPEAAAELLQFVEGVTRVGLFVDADDAWLEQVLTHVRLDLLQFHGHETPARIEAIRNEFAVPVMKVVALSLIHISQPSRSSTLPIACCSTPSHHPVRCCPAAMPSVSTGPCCRAIARRCRGCWPAA